MRTEHYRDSQTPGLWLIEFSMQEKLSRKKQQAWAVPLTYRHCHLSTGHRPGAGAEEIQGDLISSGLLLHCLVGQGKMAGIQEDQDETAKTELNPEPREIAAGCQARTEHAVALAGGQTLLARKELQNQAVF